MDVMARVALQEPLTPAEQEVCDRIVRSSNLFTILNAAFQKADLEGLKCNLSLRRKARVPCFPEKRSRAKKKSA